jgi:hypothetical protein
MITNETERHNTHMGLYGILIPYTVITFVSTDVNRIGYINTTNHGTYEAYKPWLI